MAHNINSGSCSVGEVARYLGISERNISVHYTKDANNASKPLHQFWESMKHPSNGTALSSTKGYYVSDGNGGERCVYAEYRDSNGNCYYYAQEHGNSVAEQIAKDKAVGNLSSSGSFGGTSDDFVKLRYYQLRGLEEKLNSFLVTIKENCSQMEIYMDECHALDSSDTFVSSELSEKVRKIISLLRSSIKPTESVAAKVSDITSEMQKKPF